MPRLDQAHIRFMVLYLSHHPFHLLKISQTVFFGANDACLPASPTGQYVPLAEYAQNLKNILTHPNVIAHKPRIILITPPPINEYQMELADTPNATRSSEHTKLYADKCREVGKELDVAVLDLWSILMAKTGWKEGQPLTGSKKVAKSKVLEKLLIDGEPTESQWPNSKIISTNE